MAVVCLPVLTHAQVNSGSNGSDDALDFIGITWTTNIVRDMHDHPDGIYQYTYVNIPTNVTVTFIPNANNTPVGEAETGTPPTLVTVNCAPCPAAGRIIGWKPLVNAAEMIPLKLFS